MRRNQVPNAASCQDHSIKYILNDPIIPCQFFVFLSQLLGNFPAGVLASCKKFVFRYLKNGTKILQDRNIRVAESSLPLADGRLCHI